MSFNNSGTFVYTPDINVAIYTIDNKVLDVSADIIDFSMDREINAVSTFSCTLDNPSRKYNRRINTMDRITVFLKRTNFVQCFTGLVTYAPVETLVPTPVTIQATCTLRILQVTYWDDTLIAYQQLLLNSMDTAAWSSNGTLYDGGVAQALVNVLYKVCGWNPNSIHIQGIPTNFINFAAQAYTNLVSSNEIDQNVVKELSQALSINSITSGKSVQAGGYAYGSTETLGNNYAPHGGAGVTVTASKAKAFMTKAIAGGQDNSPGKNPLNPVSDINVINEDIYWCSAPWSYLQYQIQPYMSSSKIKEYESIINDSKSWLSGVNIDNKNNSHDGRLLFLANLKWNRAVAVRATSIPQKPNVTQNGYAVYDDKETAFQCDPGVIAYLNGKTGDPGSWKATDDPGTSDITFQWADTSKIQKAGKLPDLSTTAANAYLGAGLANQSDPLVVTQALNKLVYNLIGQLGDAYSELPGTRKNPGAYGSGKGSFDCSGFAQWAYSTIQIPIGSSTWSQYGPIATPGASISGTYEQGAKPKEYGQWIPNTQQPQAGDLIFWEVPKDWNGKAGDMNENAPQHVSIMVANFGDPPPSGTPVSGRAPDTNVGYTIEASGPGLGPNIQPIYWDQVSNGKWQDWGNGWQGRIIGSRRPITLHPAWGAAAMQSFTSVSTSQDNMVANGTSTGTNPSTTNGLASQTLDPNNLQQRNITSLTKAFNNLYQMPQFDVRASAIVGTPRAFILDNPVMQDITQILGAGLRQYQSAPNGDFVAWFPDYYGVYGTDPVLDISPVEIIDFQIYHDDSQLATHVGIIGDTNGIGQQVSMADYITTNGIVSIQDASTMRLLFGKYSKSMKADTQNTKASLDFLNRYGMRPYVQEQNMIHSHSMEYMYALYIFMQQWTNQYVSTIQLTFLPELYPGMRVNMTVDNESGGTDKYQFYCTAVQHQGSRSGGFTTQATLTAPIINGHIMDYGLGIS